MNAFKVWGFLVVLSDKLWSQIGLNWNQALLGLNLNKWVYTNCFRLVKAPYPVKPTISDILVL